MIFVGLRIDETRCLGRRGEIACFVAKNWLELWKLVCRRKMFDYVAFSEYREFTRDEIEKYFPAEKIGNALKWVRGFTSENFSMEIECYFLGTKEPDMAAG